MSSALLPWYILLLPLAAATIIALFTRSWPRLSSFISVAAVLASFGMSCALFASGDLHPPELTWIDLKPVLYVPLGIVLDDLAKTMLLLVTGVGAVIHVYSLGYMREDSSKARYFASLSFFMFSMLGIVVANNFVMMFIFWELVGVSSYLLIGHWFERDSAAEAAKKAFLTNRIGDFGFMLGILMAWAGTGSVVFSEMSQQLAPDSPYPHYVTVAVLLVFCGAVGKSAQFPLHVWLPDAMEGPTPISALIHAATMVAAGVYMLVRVGFLIQASGPALWVISWVGTITALMAALIATQQDDIKRILAYSTLSQLGYMIMAVGLASGQAAMFHLFTHAFFKALLFLGAGSIIVMLHHEQNIWKMGGLAGRLGITFLTFLVGTFALIGLPPFSGFFSKDAILALAYEKDRAIFWLALTTAFLTAFYMLRLVVVVFFGKPRSDRARTGQEAPWVMIGPLILLAIPAFASGFGFVARFFVQLPAETETDWLVPGLALGATLTGAIVAIVLYRNRSTDPLDLAPLRHKFYFDELYRFLIRATQELLARLSAFIDRWILDGAAIRGAGATTWGLGSVLRLFQVGNIQGYAFLFGLGIVALIYFTVFR
jgi:NADH-quinone oxidoreductase subunit L